MTVEFRPIQDNQSKLSQNNFLSLWNPPAHSACMKLSIMPHASTEFGQISDTATRFAGTTLKDKPYPIIKSAVEHTPCTGWHRWLRTPVLTSIPSVMSSIRMQQSCHPWLILRLHLCLRFVYHTSVEAEGNLTRGRQKSLVKYPVAGPLTRLNDNT